ncbi:hypothetical protein 7AX1_61 [uncultured Caudovirales phage]|uniref:Uncharacterized protein n=1 Tax=uncultured Caudovirales phage TaxID=2100421 RepID=A0A2H4J6E2_9CAUD|nr:hypothetical protein 7AX1_61 [uncultured Caudovirales phage]AXF38251.1 hypothetical protein Quidividi_018 [Staphylococcus phage Quidividi]AXF38453.1 hypothetical protein Twillingate_017 [Staphylococcus phage Twillingate]
MTEKMIAKKQGCEFFEFTKTKTEGIDTFVTVKDIKGFAPFGTLDRVFFSRETIVQEFDGTITHHFEIIQNDDFIIDEDSEDFGTVKGF